MKITGKIEKKEEKSGTNEATQKDWKRVSYTIGGKIYSTFDQTLFSFETGQQVEGEYDQNGIYNNLTSLRLLGSVGPETSKKVRKFLLTMEEID